MAIKASLKTQIGATIWAGILAPLFCFSVPGLVYGAYYPLMGLSNPLKFWVITAMLLVVWSALLSLLLRSGWMQFMLLLVCQILLAAIGMGLMLFLYLIQVMPRSVTFEAVLVMIALLYPSGWFLAQYVAKQILRLS